jgi:tetratricopeptide (TPR) repeat protein
MKNRMNITAMQGILFRSPALAHFASACTFSYIGAEQYYVLKYEVESKRDRVEKGTKRVNKKIGYKALLFVLNIVLFQIALPQEADKMMKLRLAQGFEQAGEWERAVALYEELYTSEPANFIVMDGLQRGYTQIKEYEKAIEVIRRWLSFQPRDINMMTTLGGLYYDSGKEAAADSVWKAVLAVEPANMQFYRIVANEMMEHRMYEQCIRTYLEGRSIGKNEVLFADELGTLYAEYLRIVKTTPDQISFIQSRLSAFIVKPEALKAVSQTVRTEVNKFPDNIALHRLFAWLLLEERLYDTALDQYRIIDRLAKAQGNELFSFAQRLQQEHAFKTSAEAFQEIITQEKNPALLPYARFGYARSLEELSVPPDSLPSAGVSQSVPETESRPTYRGAVQLYETLVAQSPNPDLAMQTLYRIGIIKFEKLFDLDGALNAFNRIKALRQSSTISYDAVLKSGDVQLARNDLAEARKEYNNLGKMSVVIYQDQAAFKLAELEYFETHFDSSLSLLQRFSTNLSTDIANDALQLQYFIQENKTSTPQALTEFAKADLLMRQRKYAEALLRFQEIVRQSPAALLVDDATMKAGELQLRLNHPLEAIASFSFVADSIQTSILKDKAQMQIAETYQKILNNTAQAIEAYQKLLAQFPNSLYAEEARKRIRVLRGDSI